ncbi:MAG TPA: 50S ribosomal protein L29 [Ilumatobacter sp.]|nr:50S ribosomal protein L29 [Ilumatobacter sp.]
MAKKTANTARENPLAKLSADELAQELRETKHAALNLRFRNATGQLENTAEIRKTRRQIARINTQVRANEIAATKSES